MNSTIKTRKWAIFAAVFGLGISATFNACSDVSFKESDTLRSGTDIPNCGADACGELVPVNETLIVPVIARKADVLLVIDNSGSMTNEIRELRDRMEGFVQGLDARNIDWQMCLTLTDGSGNTRLWRGLGRAVLRKDDANRVAIFRDTMDALPEQGDGNERGITAMTSAINSSLNNDCFRNDAVLSVIVISDEDQKSCGGTCQNHPGSAYRMADSYQRQYRAIDATDQPIYFIEQAKNRFGAKPVTGHSIVIRPGDAACLDAQDRTNPAFYGTFYDTLSRATGGIIGSICAPSYAQQLADVGSNINSSLSSVSLKCPPVGGRVSLSISPTFATNHRVDGNKVFFTPAVPAGSTVTVNYTCLEPK